jgi:DNA-directed RNA polymerase subunit RPC12/RpoP
MNTPKESYPEKKDVILQYICGKCSNDVNINLKSYTKDSNIQCYNCGYKILYKKRDKTPLLYIAE